MPRSNDIWVLAADRRRARLFSADRPHSQELTEIDSFVQPAAAFKDRELVEPRPGRFHATTVSGNSRHGIDSHSSEREKARGDFVKDLVEKLEKAHHNGEFSKLVLVATPEMIGELRRQLSEKVKRDVTLEVGKDVTTMRPEEIRSHLPDKLAPTNLH